MGKLAKYMLAIECRLHDWTRHPQADAAAATMGRADGFCGLHGQKYCLLVTFRRSGAAVSTPVWFGLTDDGRLFANTGRDTLKVKRIQNDPHVCVAPCTLRGRPLGPLADGTASIVHAEGEPVAEAAIKRNYGLGRRLFQRAVGTKVDSVYIEITSLRPYLGRGLCGRPAPTRPTHPMTPL